jgi:hypothetical protein
LLKKARQFLAAGALIFVAVACGPVGGDSRREGVPDCDALPAAGEDAPGPTPTPVSLTTSRSSAGAVTAVSGGVRLTLSRVSIADYDEFFQSQGDSVKCALMGSAAAEDALTIGLIDLRVENTSSVPVTISPVEAMVRAHTEEAMVEPRLSGALGGTYEPGMAREGRLIFFLSDASAASVEGVLYGIEGPLDDSLSPLGEDIRLAVPLEAR